ncbi:MAG: hypothetical protein KHZ62_05550 [Clostridiales bacterium]|nr:hypothetical protein [Clostridiales bacterium]
MKKFISVTFVLGISVMLTACMHTHTWEDATCTAPKTCSECGETEGEPLGHTWQEATCSEPKTCSLCGETEGEPLEHKVESWTVEREPKCAFPGEKNGICSKCGKLVRLPIFVDHTPGKWVIEKEPTSDSPGERTLRCVFCNQVIKTEEFTQSLEEIEAEFKASCTVYDYNTLARNPDDYIATYGKYTAMVIQVIEEKVDQGIIELLVLIPDETGLNPNNIMFVEHSIKEGEPRLLQYDSVTIYGMNMGTTSYITVRGDTLTVPLVDAEYIELN